MRLISQGSRWIVPAWLLLNSISWAEIAPQFSRDVLPILAAKCFACHGPDASKRKADLRLDEAAFAFAALRPGEFPIVPDNPGESLVLQRIEHADPAERMPPADFPKPLTPDEVVMLRRWIETGAAWESHWAFAPLSQPEPPAVSNPDWPRNPIDQFVLAAQDARGLSPAPEADRATLARRLYFDLTGLPPTPEAVEALVRDPAPDAYEKLVDELLASPRHGERWARHWLDVAHYGETHGYDKDKRREHAWPYRDYVIAAFNDDKPYGQFVQGQIAGDVLFPESPAATVALGFLSAGPWDFVGHVELREDTTDKAITRTLDRDDVVANVMGTFTSLTVHCARCHDHKFDPISQADYYALQSNFAGVERANRPYDADPAVHAQRNALLREQRDLEARRAALEARRAAVTSPELDAREAKRAQLAEELNQQEVTASPSNGYHSAIVQSASAVKWVQVDLGEAVVIEAVRLVPAMPTDFPDTLGFGFPVRFRVEASNDADFAAATILLDQTAADFAGEPGATLEVTGSGAPARYVRVTATRLWERTADYVFALSELQVIAGGENLALGRAVEALDSIDAGRWQTAYLVDGYDSRERLRTGAESPEDRKALRILKRELRRATREAEELRTAALSPADQVALGDVTASLDRVNASLSALLEPALVYAATADFKSEGSFTPSPGPRPVFVLTRGDVNAPAERALPGTVGCVPALPARFGLEEGYAEGEARAALAQWITHPDNPLTWRSIVNRVWQYHMGKGIVDTPNDFGRMGSPPTHPELLDWLTNYFLEHGQSLKALHRLIVTSATYRQQSAPAADYTALDSSNQYLWHAERRPLESEALRDAVLAASGKLDLTMGGPPFDTYVFEDDHSPRYGYAEHDPSDPRAFRRAIYRSIVRSVPDPWMTSLDCADPSQSVPVRNQTITALQALALFNNPFVVRQAAFLAERVAAEVDTLDAQLSRAWSLALSQPPSPVELAQLRPYAEAHGLPAACRLILNTNAFFFVD